MKGPGEVFSYTAKKGEYLSMAIAFVMLIILEAIGFDLLIALLVHGWLKFVLLGIIVFLHIFAIILLFAPLFTKHRLSDTHLQLRYSFLFKANLARSNIVAAEPVKEKLDSALNLAPFYHRDRQRLNLPFSTEGQVLLHLEKPQTLRYGLYKKGKAGQILFNVDHRDLFLQALALPVKATAPSTSSLNRQDRDLIPG